MQWHKRGPDAPLSCCWPPSPFQSLRKGLEVEKVLGTGHIAALITHSVTIEPNVWPPPIGVNSFLTSRESNGASVACLPVQSQDSSSVPSLRCCWLTAAKCFRPTLLTDNGGCEALGDRGTLHPIKGFYFFARCVVQTKRLFWGGVLSIRGLASWHPYCTLTGCFTEKTEERDRICPPG